MDISLFSKCIKDLIVENDEVDVPYLGTFKAEMMPATYSDRQTTIHPPYRKMSFHKGEVTLAQGRPLLDKVRRMLGVSLDQAGVELGWCLSRLSSELEGSKTCRLPGLGVMRANARNEFFFVPDDDLDIWPDGVGFEAIAIKVSENKDEMPGQAGRDKSGQAEHDQAVEEPSVAADGISASERSCEQDEKPEPRSEAGESVGGPGGADVVLSGQALSTARNGSGRALDESQPRPRKRLSPWIIVLIVVVALLVLFVAASYLFTDEMSPILDRLLYSKEELELLKGAV